MGPHGFKEWLDICAEQEFSHFNSDPVNALDLSTERSNEIFI